jgi:four helix bundle protein
MPGKFHFKFEDLMMYQKALDYADFVYEQVRKFPKEETYRLASQFIRAADAIALNIAAGSSSTKPNFNRYLQVAWDSAHEYVVCSTKSKRRGFIDEQTNERNRELLTELSKMITSYKNYLNKSQTK